MLSCSIWFSAPGFWMVGGLESCCVGRVYGADGARLTRIITVEKRSSDANMTPLELVTSPFKTPSLTSPYNRLVFATMRRKNEKRKRFDVQMESALIIRPGCQKHLYELA